MALPFLIEELIVDDSFISYCYNRDSADVAFWRAYLMTYPQEQPVVDEAKDIIIRLTKMLQYEQAQLSPEGHPSNSLYVAEYTSDSDLNILEVINVRKRNRLWIGIAVSVLLIATIFLILPFRKDGAAKSILADVSDSTLYKTIGLEKKVIYLPDSTRVVLNKNSSLIIGQDYGKNNREVTLSGEGYFDVRRDEKKPFLVKLNKYSVRVLGTVFNIRDYPEDYRSETSLVSGKVEILMKKGESFFLYNTLRPKQKFILYNKDTLPDNDVNENHLLALSQIESISYTMDKEIKETGWVQDRLYIEDETFADLQQKLERWYNVKIVFLDSKVKYYRFTATFENEPIETVMKALQLSYPFNYTIDKKEIIITKGDTK